MRASWTAAVLAGLMLTGAANAEPVQLGSLTIERAWARETAPSQKNGAVYLTVRNDGATPDRLLAASAELAERTELHESAFDAQGVARMRPVPAVDLPPAGEARLQPGGSHIMLVGLKAPLQGGSTFPLLLRFEQAGETRIEVTVESMRGSTRPAHQHGNH